MNSRQLAFDAEHAHIGAADAAEVQQRRANITAAAEIRAALYTSCSLPPATGCAAAAVCTHRPATSCGRGEGGVCAAADSVRCRTQGEAA